MLLGVVPGDLLEAHWEVAKAVMMTARTSADRELWEAVGIAREVISIVILLWLVISLRIIDHSVVVVDRGVLGIVRRLARMLIMGR